MQRPSKTERPTLELEATQKLDPAALTIPELFSTERLDIHAPSIDHAGEIRTAIEESFAEIHPWLPWASHVPSREECEENQRNARARWEAREDFRLNVFLKGTGTFVAGSGLHAPDWSVPKFEIGYWVRSRFSGNGYVTEAVRAISAFGFRVFGAKRIEIFASSRNVRSCNVATHAGFVHEGTLRNHERHVDGTLRDTEVFAKIAE